MKRFQFQLDSVLHWRKLQLEIEEAALQKLFAELTRIGEIRVEMQRQRDLTERSVKGQPTATTDQLQSLDSFELYAQHQLLRIGETETECRQRIAAQQTKVTIAQRNVALLEKLKANRQHAWTAANKRELETLAGELYLAKLVREADY